jgi:manganese/zinc/iron transport system permease protein
MFLSPHRGLVVAAWRRWSLARRVSAQHVLRAMAELEEQNGEGSPMRLEDLLLKRSWTRTRLRHLIGRALKEQWVRMADEGFVLTDAGRVAARRVLRNHRLWEMYLIKHADIAPSHVDRDADEIEHVLSETMVQEIERAVVEQLAIPASPHGEGTRP